MSNAAAYLGYKAGSYAKKYVRNNFLPRVLGTKSNPYLGGFTFPRLTGSSHMGPGNKVGAKSYSKRDAIYRAHDMGYSKLIKSRGKLATYFLPNTADDKLIRQLAKSRNPYDKAARKFFQAKKVIGTPVVRVGRLLRKVF